MFLESGHFEILLVLLIAIGALPPEHAAALARRLGKLYYEVNKALDSLTKGGPAEWLGKVGYWRAKRAAGALKGSPYEVLKETKRP